MEMRSPLFSKLPIRGLLGNWVARVVVLESVLILMIEEKELQRWEHQKYLSLEFLGFARST
jgi:hypothetical protein